MFQQMRHMHGIPFDLGRDGATCVALPLAVEGDVKSIEGERTTVNTDIDRRLQQSAGGRKRDFYSFVTAPDETAGFTLDLGLYLRRKRAGRQTKNKPHKNCVARLWMHKNLLHLCRFGRSLCRRQDRPKCQAFLS